MWLKSSIENDVEIDPPTLEKKEYYKSLRTAHKTTKEQAHHKKPHEKFRRKLNNACVYYSSLNYYFTYFSFVC